MRPRVPKRQPPTSATSGALAVDAYLAAVPEPARTMLEQLRATIRSAAPQTTTEAISYGVPSFQYKGGLVVYAAYKRHCSLFPMGFAALEPFADELAEFRTSKGTLQFTPEKPLPAALVRKIVKACVARNEAVE